MSSPERSREFPDPDPGRGQRVAVDRPGRARRRDCARTRHVLGLVSTPAPRGPWAGRVTKCIRWCALPRRFRRRGLGRFHPAAAPVSRRADHCGADRRRSGPAHGPAGRAGGVARGDPARPLPARHPQPARPVLHALSELGVVILLFQIGLAHQPEGHPRGGGPADHGRCGRGVLPFVGGVLRRDRIRTCRHHRGGRGAALTATSIGISARVLSDLGQLEPPRDASFSARRSSTIVPD